MLKKQQQISIDSGEHSPVKEMKKQNITSLKCNDSDSW